MTTEDFNVAQRAIAKARRAVVTLPEHVTLRTYAAACGKAEPLTEHMAATLAVLCEQFIINMAKNRHNSHDPLDLYDLS